MGGNSSLQNFAWSTLIAAVIVVLGIYIQKKFEPNLSFKRFQDSVKGLPDAKEKKPSTPSKTLLKDSKEKEHKRSETESEGILYVEGEVMDGKTGKYNTASDDDSSSEKSHSQTSMAPESSKTQEEED